MGRRGPPPKPTALKVVQGNPGKRQLNKAEPKPSEGKAAPPEWLKGRGRKAWDELAPHVEEMKVLTPADAAAFALLCEAYAEYIQARSKIRRKGATYDSATEHGVITRPRPEVKIASDAWRRVRAMMLEFGITPSSRSRIVVGGTEPTEDPFEQWEKRGKK